MKPSRRAMWRVLLIPVLILPAIVGCGSNTPSAAPSASPPTTTAPSAVPTVSPTPSPTTTAAPTPSPTPPANSGWTVVSSGVTYGWQWPDGNPVTITQAVPAGGELVTIGAGNHPTDPGDRPYNRMSFSFLGGYPNYTFQYVDQLIQDGSGKTIPLEGKGILRIVFHPAWAHTQDGTASTIQSQPPAHLGMSRMVAYAQAGDFEGYLSYGIGITWPNPRSNPQIAVRVYQVTYVNSQGQHRYVVAFDVDAR